MGFYEGSNLGDENPLQVFAAPYLGDPEGEGIFVFEAIMENMTTINEDGFFQLPNLEPGFYILLIGPDVNQAEAYKDGNTAVKIEVFAGEYTDVGLIIK